MNASLESPLGVCGLEPSGHFMAICIISLVLQPLLCVVGLALNLVSIAIFCLALWRGHRTTMVVYLIALCVFDSFQLLLSLPILYLNDLRFFYKPESEGLAHIDQVLFDRITTVHCYSTFYLYPILMAANYGSIWVVTLICVQRYFAICFPLSNLRTIELRKATREIMVLGLTAFLLNLSRYGEFRILPFREPNSTAAYAHLIPGPLFPGNNHVYMLIMDGVIYTLFIYVFPFTIVTILNARILWVIYRARKLLPRMTQRHRKEHRSAFMILAIILLFLGCYTLAVAERLWSIFDAHAAASEFGMLLNASSNFLVNVNSALDPLMYALFSRGFRDLFLRMRKGGGGPKSFVSENSAAAVTATLGRKRMLYLRRRPPPRTSSQLRVTLVEGRRQSSGCLIHRPSPSLSPSPSR